MKKRAKHSRERFMTKNHNNFRYDRIILKVFGFKINFNYLKKDKRLTETSFKSINFLR